MGRSMPLTDIEEEQKISRAIVTRLAKVVEVLQNLED
jgi:hypothetical protein